MREKVKTALTELQRRLRGATVILEGCDEGIVKVRIVTGFCTSAVPKDIVFEIVEKELKDQVPEIKEVLAI